MEMTPPVGRAGSPAEWQEAERKDWYRVWGVSRGDAVPGCTRWLGREAHPTRQVPSCARACQPLLRATRKQQSKHRHTTRKQVLADTDAAVPLILGLQSCERDSSAVSKPPGPKGWKRAGCSYPDPPAPSSKDLHSYSRTTASQVISPPSPEPSLQHIGKVPFAI